MERMRRKHQVQRWDLTLVMEVRHRYTGSIGGYEGFCQVLRGSARAAAGRHDW